MKLKPGVSLGQYRIVSELGRGGMAAVCKAWQPSLERHVAIKVLPQFFADDPTFRERFRREALTIASLNHPGILPIYEFSATGRITYIVGDLIGGGTLADRVGDRLPLDEVGRLLRPVAEDLDFAHSRGVLHRDVKPANVLLREGGSAVTSRLWSGAARNWTLRGQTRSS